jgi:hypothetical protein
LGQLVYGSGLTVEIDDWGLEHLHTVIITKLRRDESFSFSWDAGSVGITDKQRAAGTIWVSRASTLFFSFDSPRGGKPLNRRWLEELARAASGSSGLRLLPEPVAPR